MRLFLLFDESGDFNPFDRSGASTRASPDLGQQVTGWDGWRVGWEEHLETVVVGYVGSEDCYYTIK